MLDPLLDALRRFDALRDQGPAADRLSLRTLPSRGAEYAPTESLENVLPLLRHNLALKGIFRLYRHQAEAVELGLKGEDLVLESPTASGKTLAFGIPLVQNVLEPPEGKGLLLYPMKALSSDQMRQLIDLAGLPDIASIYDGSLEREAKWIIRRFPPPILLTNPEMLHQSFMSETRWDGFLRRLRVVVIDEMHEYRGFFGTNVALLLRRFLRKLDELGARPQLILATATCGNPLEHAERLTGRKSFRLVRASHTMRPQRHFVFINPQIPDFHFLDIYMLRVVRAGLAALKLGLSTLVFCPSRRFVDEAHQEAVKQAPRFGLSPETIVPYRAGYSAAARMTLEQGVREGRHNLIFCTNALEVGIDVGRLDCCILAGFPDNVMSAWQRIGRTGRTAERPAYVLFLAMNGAFDQFFSANIDAFMDKPLDQILIGVDNDELIKRHIPYLLRESAWSLPDSQRELLGPALFEAAHRVIAVQKPVRGVGPNYGDLDLRGASGGIRQLICDGAEIGTMSELQQFREGYLGAIYRHLGEVFRVTAHEGSRVLLQKAPEHLRSEARLQTAIARSQASRGFRYLSAIGGFYGSVDVEERFSGYKCVDQRDGQIVSTDQSTGTLRRTVRAFWVTLETADEFLMDPGQSLRVVEQFTRIGLSLVIPCDRHDVASLTLTSPVPTMYLYETVPGGIGIAEKMLAAWPAVVRCGRDLAKRCECLSGCARCIHPPRYRPSATGPLRKTVGYLLADLVATMGAAEEELDPGTNGWRQAV